MHFTREKYYNRVITTRISCSLLLHFFDLPRNPCDRILRYISEPAAVLLHCSAMTLSMRHRDSFARIQYHVLHLTYFGSKCASKRTFHLKRSLLSRNASFADFCIERNRDRERIALQSLFYFKALLFVDYNFYIFLYIYVNIIYITLYRSC